MANLNKIKGKKLHSLVELSPKKRLFVSYSIFYSSQPWAWVAVWQWKYNQKPSQSRSSHKTETIEAVEPHATWKPLKEKKLSSFLHSIHLRTGHIDSFWGRSPKKGGGGKGRGTVLAKQANGTFGFEEERERESKNYVAVLEFPTKEGKRKRVREREKKGFFFEGSAHDCFSIPMLFSSFCILHTLRRAAARKKDKRVRRCAQGKCLCVCVCVCVWERERERERERVSKFWNFWRRENRDDKFLKSWIKIDHLELLMFLKIFALIILLSSSQEQKINKKMEFMVRSLER